MSETTDVLSQAVEEIKRLRHDNEILQAKVDVMELFREALAHPPVQTWQSQTMQVDPLWNVARHLDDLIQADKVTGRLQGISGLAQALSDEYVNEGGSSVEEAEGRTPYRAANTGSYPAASAECSAAFSRDEETDGLGG